MQELVRSIRSWIEASLSPKGAGQQGRGCPGSRSPKARFGVDLSPEMARQFEAYMKASVVFSALRLRFSPALEVAPEVWMEASGRYVEVELTSAARKRFMERHPELVAKRGTARRGRGPARYPSTAEAIADAEPEPTANRDGGSTEAAPADAARPLGKAGRRRQRQPEARMEPETKVAKLVRRCRERGEDRPLLGGVFSSAGAAAPRQPRGEAMQNIVAERRRQALA